MCTYNDEYESILTFSSVDFQVPFGLVPTPGGSKFIRLGTGGARRVRRAGDDRDHHGNRTAIEQPADRARGLDGGDPVSDVLVVMCCWW